MRTVEISPSTLTNIQSCQMLANYQSILRWTPNEKPESYEKGDIPHTALKYYYTALMLSQSTGIPFNKLEVIRESLLAASQGALDSNLPIEEAERIVRLTEGYFHHYDEELKIHAVERPFSKIMYENESEDLRIVFIGVIDLLAESKITNLAVYDHKSQGSDYQLIERDNQFIGYAWALDTSWVIGNRIGLQKSEPKHGRYRRQTLGISDAVKEQWKNQAIKDIKRFVTAYNAKDFDYNFSHCKVWGGCKFKDICNAAYDKDVQLHLLMKNFYIKPEFTPYRNEQAVEFKE